MCGDKKKFFKTAPRDMSHVCLDEELEGFRVSSLPLIIVCIKRGALMTPDFALSLRLFAKTKQKLNGSLASLLAGFTTPHIR